MFIVARENKGSKIPSAAVRTHDTCPQVFYFWMFLAGCVGRTVSFMDLWVSWYSGTTPVNQWGPKWRVSLHCHSVKSESQRFMFQYLSPQLLQKEEGIALTHQSSVSRIRVSFSFWRQYRGRLPLYSASKPWATKRRWNSSQPGSWNFRNRPSNIAGWQLLQWNKFRTEIASALRYLSVSFDHTFA